MSSDQGFPPMHGHIAVTICVDNDQFRPVFQNVEVNITIHERYNEDQFVTSVSADDDDLRQVEYPLLYLLSIFKIYFLTS